MNFQSIFTPDFTRTMRASANLILLSTSGFSTAQESYQKNFFIPMMSLNLLKQGDDSGCILIYFGEQTDCSLNSGL